MIQSSSGCIHIMAITGEAEFDVDAEELVVTLRVLFESLSWSLWFPVVSMVVTLLMISSPIVMYSVVVASVVVTSLVVISVVVAVLEASVYSAILEYNIILIKHLYIVHCMWYSL